MNKTRITSLIMIVLLILPLIIVIGHTSQPPINVSMTVEGQTGWGPIRADPARLYDGASEELAFNVYEGLIASNQENYYDFKPLLAINVPSRVDRTVTVTNTSTVDLANPRGSTWSDRDFNYTCRGYFDYSSSSSNLGQGDVIYLADNMNVYRTWYVQAMNFGSFCTTMILWRGSYTFRIRTSPIISFVNETGQTVDTFDAQDALYSFERNLVQNQAGSPIWMFDKAQFGTMDLSLWGNSTADPTLYPIMDAAHLIANAYELSGNDFIINLGIPFPDNAFKQILSNTWGSIVSKDFSTSIGCWNGDLFAADPTDPSMPNWFTHVLGVSRSPYDTVGAYRFVGTGPYYISTYDQVNNRVIMSRNDAYWGGWPAPGCNGSIQTYDIEYVQDDTVRLDGFTSGTYDVAAIPRSMMFHLLNNATKEPDLTVDPYMKTIKNIAPSISVDALMFTFTVDPASTYIGSGYFPDGIPTNFFNNTHVRKAFAYAFNATEYSNEVWYGETYCRKNILAAGLYPDYYNSSISGYDVSLANAKNELQQAMFGNTSVWNSGFTFTLVYPSSFWGYRTGFQIMVECEILRDFFGNLSFYDNRAGPPFSINVNEQWDWMSRYPSNDMLIWDIGWLGDFAAPDNFVRPYMHSTGDFASFQNYTADNGWTGAPYGNKDALIEEALTTLSESTRQTDYQKLQQIFYNDCPCIPIPTPTGRLWCQYWVKGWYYNAMYPGLYIRSLWKADDCWFDVSGPTVGVSDGKTDMRDISYLILHFNAKAPSSATTPDPKWVGMYGANGCVDPYGDRVCNMRDISGAILHFNHKNGTLTP